MSHWKTLTRLESGFVEVLTSDRTGTPFGYHLSGASPGPLFAVFGTCEAGEMVFDRLLRIPTLPWMRGRLLLIRLDALGDTFTELAELSKLGPVDKTMILSDSPARDASVLRAQYHQVLRTCARLGMIAGRGVAACPDA